MQHGKSWCVYLSLVNKQVLQNNCLKIHMTGIVTVFVTAVLIIQANNKHSV